MLYWHRPKIRERVKHQIPLLLWSAKGRSKAKRCTFKTGHPTSCYIGIESLKRGWEHPVTCTRVSPGTGNKAREATHRCPWGWPNLLWCISEGLHTTRADIFQRPCWASTDGFYPVDHWRRVTKRWRGIPVAFYPRPRVCPFHQERKRKMETVIYIWI